MNRTDSFLRKSSVALRSPSLHPKLGSPASTARELPLHLPLPDLGTHLSAASLPRSTAPRAGPVPREQSGGLGTDPCFSEKPQTSRRLICPAAPRPGVQRCSHREAAPPRRPSLSVARAQLLITAARCAPPGTTASAGPDCRACAVRPGALSLAGGSSCPPVRRAPRSRRGRRCGQIRL